MNENNTCVVVSILKQSHAAIVSSYAARKGEILWHYRHTLCMDRAEIPNIDSCENIDALLYPT
jgi:hypothetical protein